MAPQNATESFRLGLGHPALELVATLAGRHRQPTERLVDPTDLDRWLAATGLAANAGCAPSQLTQARRLREAIYRLIEAARMDKRAKPHDVALVNEWARRAKAAPQLDADLRAVHQAGNPCTAALAEVAASAVELIGGADRTRIRNCADPTCSLMFIDHSRPGRRRWCSMERCGNRAKTAHYRNRRKPTTRT